MAATPTKIDPVRAAESNTAMLVAVLTVFHVLALVFVSLRVYARAVIIKTFGKDDIFMVLSAVCCKEAKGIGTTLTPGSSVR